MDGRWRWRPEYCSGARRNRWQQRIDLRQAGPAVGACPQARANLTDISELVLLDGAQDGVAANRETRAYERPRLLAFDDRAGRQKRQAMRSLQLFDAKEVGQEVSVRQVRTVCDIHTGLEPVIHDMRCAVGTSGRIFIFDVISVGRRSPEQGASPFRPGRGQIAARYFVTRAVCSIDLRPPCHIERAQTPPRQQETVPLDWKGLDVRWRMFELRLARNPVHDRVDECSHSRLRCMTVIPMHGNEDGAAGDLATAS